MGIEGTPWPVFVELPAFEQYRAQYLDDDAFLLLQQVLIANPRAGNPIPGTGGLFKLRFEDKRRNKGKRGGLRVIYYFWQGGPEFWLFTLFDKDEASDLTANQKALLKERIKQELQARQENSEAHP